MQIFFAFLVLMFAILSVAGVTFSADYRRNTQSLAREMHLNTDIQTKLGHLAKKAYDNGRVSGTCPAGTDTFSGVGVPPVRLCWTTGIMSGRCFNSVKYRGESICLANNQTSLTSASTPKTWYALLLKPTNTWATVLRDPPGWGNFEAGMVEPDPKVNASGGNHGKAFVRLPPPEASPFLRGNRIDCTETHTECFTVVYCLDGSLTCTGNDRFATTYAARHF